MSEILFEDAFDYEELLDGISEAVTNYQAAVEEAGVDFHNLPEEGITVEQRNIMSGFNSDVFVPDALKLTEDVFELTLADGFKELESDYIDRQYAMDDFVGNEVGKRLFEIMNTVELREVLPDKTVAIVEVNANRGFDRGSEDNKGCYGLPINWLGHVVVDTEYEGPSEITNSYATPTGVDKRRIDYLGEPGSWTTFTQRGLERNEARIRIRPSYPVDPRRSMFDFTGSREVFEKRLGLIDTEEPLVFHEHAVLRGEYRICRAVVLLHDLSDWRAEDFVSGEELLQRSLDIDLGRTRAE
jgi:hypothetical protein